LVCTEDEYFDYINLRIIIAIWHFNILLSICGYKESSLLGYADIVLTDVLEERIAFIFRVEENPRARNQCEQVLIVLYFFIIM
jgi:hypothetical protein